MINGQSFWMEQLEGQRWSNDLWPEIREEDGEREREKARGKKEFEIKDKKCK